MDLSVWRTRCLEWQARDLGSALAYFTFIADVTALAADCRFAGDEDVLPFAAIAFHGAGPAQVAVLTRQLLAPEEPFYCLVGEEQWPLVQAAYRVVEVHEEWQMLFRGDPAALDPGDAVPLDESDLTEMAALAWREDMMAFERDPLARGPWYGVRCDGVLVTQGGTHLMLSRAVEIGNIVTSRAHRRRGYGSQVVAALVRALEGQGRAVFLQVFKDNEAAIACYERLGFERLRTMMLARCRLAGCQP
jgi:RimJ/RimL family protein N-acetyltransferase